MSDNFKARIEAAEAELTRVEREKVALELEINEEKHRASAEIDKRFENQSRAMRDRVNAARQAVIAAKNATPDHPWAGKRVFVEYTTGASYKQKHVRMDGIVEMRRSDTQFPANYSNWRLPRLGEPFVRLIKGDGTTGLKFEGMTVAGRAWRLLEPASQQDAPTNPTPA